MILKLSASLVLGPKFIVPRQSRLTLSPVLPNVVYSMSISFQVRLSITDKTAQFRENPEE